MIFIILLQLISLKFAYAMEDLDLPIPLPGQNKTIPTLEIDNNVGEDNPIYYPDINNTPSSPDPKIPELILPTSESDNSGLNIDLDNILGEHNALENDNQNNEEFSPSIPHLPSVDVEELKELTPIIPIIPETNPTNDLAPDTQNESDMIVITDESETYIPDTAGEHEKIINGNIIPQTPVPQTPAPSIPSIPDINDTPSNTTDKPNSISNETIQEEIIKKIEEKSNNKESTYNIDVALEDLWKDSIMFSKQDIDLMNAAIYHFRYGHTNIPDIAVTPQHPGIDINSGLDITPTNTKRKVSIYLKSILYINENQWAVWINNQKITSDNAASGKHGFRILDVQPSRITLRLPLDDNMELPASISTTYGIPVNYKHGDKEVTFSLHTNQTFNASDMTIIDGR